MILYTHMCGQAIALLSVCVANSRVFVDLIVANFSLMATTLVSLLDYGWCMERRRSICWVWCVILPSSYT